MVTTIHATMLLPVSTALSVNMRMGPYMKENVSLATLLQSTLEGPERRS